MSYKSVRQKLVYIKQKNKTTRYNIFKTESLENICYKIKVRILHDLGFCESCRSTSVVGLVISEMLR
jgi:hypothetical protein